MIEVEKKFQPTKEQLEKLLDGGVFVGEKQLADIYYDLPDFSYFKQNIRIRNRNGVWELKANIKTDDPNQMSVSKEVTTESEIIEILGFDSDTKLVDLVKSKFKELFTIRNHRKTYTKDEFTIDVDSLDIGYDLCEIELLVDDEIKIKDAETKIISFVEKYGLEIKDLPSKRALYFQKFYPEAYKKITSEK